MSASTTNEPASMRTALVIGAHGFLGGFIASALRARGWRVIDVVRNPDAGNDPRVIAETARTVVIADACFTAPAVIIQLLSG